MHIMPTIAARAGEDTAARKTRAHAALFELGPNDRIGSDDRSNWSVAAMTESLSVKLRTPKSTSAQHEAADG
jgi:hypothetical protein